MLAEQGIIHTITLNRVFVYRLLNKINMVRGDINTVVDQLVMGAILLNNEPFYLQMALGVSALGALGVLARFVVVHFVARYFSVFPMGTLLVNVVGSFIIGGVFAFFSARTDFSEVMSILLVSGFLGGFTTFSSFSMELLELYREGRLLIVFFYGIGGPVLGVWAAAAGAFVAGLRIG